LIEKLAGGATPDNALNGLTDTVPDTYLLEHRKAIDEIFALNSVEFILSALDAEETDWADDTAKTLRAKSPTSLKIAVRQMREGAKLEFDDCMKMEYRMVNRIVAGRDFYEGVRAVIIDKDNQPKWQPADPADVSDADVDAYFAPLGEKELKL
jgi:enoyl-CoA hydratase